MGPPSETLILKEKKMPNLMTVKDSAKRVKETLNQMFPKVRFNVRSEKYAGGASIDVRWADGPTGARVQAGCDLHKGSIFVDYIFPTRSYSPTAYAEGLRVVCERYGLAVPATRLYPDGAPHIAAEDDPFVGQERLSLLVWRELEGMDFQTEQKGARR